MFSDCRFSVGSANKNLPEMTDVVRKGSKLEFFYSYAQLQNMASLSNRDIHDYVFENF